jgi:hypothetical protein
MMSRIDTPPDPDPHAEARELLPWLANGTLAGAELERVRGHVDACQACRETLAWEQGLHAARQTDAPLLAQEAFAALLPRLGAQEAGSQQAPAGDWRKQPGGHRPEQPRGTPGRWAGLAAANDPLWLRALAAIQLGIMVTLGLALWLALAGPRGAESRSTDPSYQTLGAHAAAAGNIVVSFDPATPERELRRILQASGGRIVDGPTVGGAYVLAVEPAGAKPALQRLRSEPVVRLAEPLVLESPR